MIEFKESEKNLVEQQEITFLFDSIELSKQEIDKEIQRLSSIYKEYNFTSSIDYHSIIVKKI